MDTVNTELIRGHVDTIILNSLDERDRYGYEILDIISDLSEGRYEIKQPTLYSCLKRLEKQGFISSYFGDETQGGTPDDKAEVFMGNLLTELRAERRMILYNALNAQKRYTLEDGVFTITTADDASRAMLTEEHNLKTLEDAAEKLSKGTVKLVVAGGEEQKRVRHTAVDRAKLYDILGDRLRDKK